MSRLLLLRRSLWTTPVSGPESFQVLGTAYEKEVAGSLETYLGMRVKRVGGRGDNGIDLAVDWDLPGSNQHRVIIQCKRITSKASPRLVRELEGTILTSGIKDIGILASTMEPSEQCLERIRHSKLCLMFMKICNSRIESFYSSHTFQSQFRDLIVAPIKQGQDLHYEFYYNQVRLSGGGPSSSSKEHGGEQAKEGSLPF